MHPENVTQILKPQITRDHCFDLFISHSSRYTVDNMLLGAIQMIRDTLGTEQNCPKINIFNSHRKKILDEKCLFIFLFEVSFYLFIAILRAKMSSVYRVGS